MKLKCNKKYSKICRTYWILPRVTIHVPESKSLVRLLNTFIAIQKALAENYSHNVSQPPFPAACVEKCGDYFTQSVDLVSGVNLIASCFVSELKLLSTTYV